MITAEGMARYLLPQHHETLDLSTEICIQNGILLLSLTTRNTQPSTEAAQNACIAFFFSPCCENIKLLTLIPSEVEPSLSVAHFTYRAS